MNHDPIVQTHREQIAALDLQILEALNQRITLVQHLAAHKRAQGLSLYDPAQEERVLADLQRANGGPLSAQGLQETFSLIMRWAKREAGDL